MSVKVKIKLKGKDAKGMLKSDILGKIKARSNPVFNNHLQSIVHLADSVKHNADHAKAHQEEILKNQKDMAKHFKAVSAMKQHMIHE